MECKNAIQTLLKIFSISYSGFSNRELLTDQNEFTRHVSVAENPYQRQIPFVEMETPTANARYTNINRVLVATENQNTDPNIQDDLSETNSKDKDNIHLQSFSVPKEDEYHLHTSLQFQPYVNSGGLSEDYEYYNII